MKERLHTKDKILNAAFKVLLEIPFTRLSLSDIAAHVGITKPAIYRHFTSKENLLQEMDRTFYDQFADFFRIQKRDMTQFEFGVAVFDFYAKRPGYLNFFMMKVISIDKFEEAMTVALAERGIIMKTTFIGDDAEFSIFNGEATFRFPISVKKGNSQAIFLRQLFFTATGTFCTMFSQRHMIQQNKTLPDDFSRRLATIATVGWNVLQPINPSRIAILNRCAVVARDELPPFDKFPIAIANVIKKYGFSGTTIERIAEELGLAKSSFYSHFSSKTQFLSEFITNEIATMADLILNRIKEAQNLSEAVYMYLYSIASYAIARSEILPVFGWLRNSGYLIHNKLLKKPCEIQFFSQFPEFKALDLGIDVAASNTLLFTWIHAVSITMVIQFSNRGYSNTEIMDSIPLLYGFMQHGLHSDAVLI